MTPQTEAELAAIVAKAEGPFRVQGGGTRPIGAASNATVLTTRALAGVELYEPGALTLVVKAGTPLSEVEALLTAEGQRLPFEPMDHRGMLGTTGTPTIGGVFAANVSGPRRIQAGAARDYLLGVRFVDGRGKVLRNGGRVMKNVTGYDLVKLMAGSFGTLGVLTEVALKVLPDTATTATLTLPGLDDVTAVKALSRALGSPFEVTGAAHRPHGPDSQPQTLLRLEGSEKSVAYRASELAKILAPFGTLDIMHDTASSLKIWRDIRDVAPFQVADGDVWRLSVKPSDAPGVVAQIPRAQALYDWGGGLIWLLVPPGTAADRVRAPLATVAGHATMIRGADAGPAFHPLDPTVQSLHHALRQKFDPRGLFNPSLMGQAA
ncbi:glycolate oxidase subunit GlcE [Roseovarius gahaiensis]|uniref:Glycolate oxidase subunit GlcE n=1 Tax=Roseovarius gahaiensis TaxID=2716691 RepID=A0A967BCE2_9RHOB|nr:glycolate oxidase subunit GlcE [Roseovarius gahaiensis]NHQ75420.1 glycolate oxidase subunit GlcE [Roseovarius gahaiensis]